MSKQHINPAELFDASAFGMSQAVIANTSGLVFVSGQVDWNNQYEITETTVAGQMQKALENLRIALEASGSSIDQLLQIRVYVRGELGEHRNTIAPILVDFLGESRPAATAIGVTSLATPETLVEIEGIASTD